MAHTQTKPLSVTEQVKYLPFKTPYFFTSLETIKQNYRHFDNLFDDAEVCYAMKANADPRILTYLNSLGSSFEAASGYEITSLINTGVSPANIIYGTSIKPPEHIALAHSYGVKRMAVDSKEEIDKVAEHAPGAKVYIRCIVDDADSVFTMSERFGTPSKTVHSLALYARSVGLKLYGISFYVGSQAAHSNMWAKGIHTVRPIIEALEADGIRIEALNIGGGFPVHYDNHRDAPMLHRIVVDIHNALHTLPYMPKLIMEPGRGLVATSTVLVSEIIARSDRFNKPWICMDAGIYNALYEAMIHQGATCYPIALYNQPEGNVDESSFTLAGPTGDSLDIIARDVSLPDYLGIGDRLIFENAGAYTVTMASRFNGFPAPPLYIG